MSSYVGGLFGCASLLLTQPWASSGYQTGTGALDEVLDLHLQDQYGKAKETLDKLRDRPDVIAFKGEIQFGKGEFEEA